MNFTDPQEFQTPGIASSSSPYLRQLDVVPLEASLQRLYNAKINVEEEHQHDYAILQAVRGVLHATKSTRAFFTPQHTIGAHVGSGVAAATEVKGSHLTLYRVALGSLQSTDTLRTSSYLSCRLLCDEATHYGEGNDCPSCTEEWTAAILTAGQLLSPKYKSSGAEEFSTTASGGGIPFAVNRKFHLGYLLIVLETLRTVATGGVTGKQLSSHYMELLQGWVELVLPAVAVLAEEHPTTTTSGGGGGGNDAASAPSRLTVEANHAIIHSLHWMTVDILRVHTGSNASPKNKRVLDRDFPPRLWGCLGMLRRALDRALTWLKQEMVVSHGCAPKALALVDTVMHSYQWMFDDMSKKYDQLSCACRAARQQYGDSAKAVTEITDLMWVQTMRLCLLIRDVTGSWVATQGGLCLAYASSGIVLFQYKDVVAYVASALSHVTGTEGKENEFDLFVSSNAFLTAMLAVVAAAPSSALQEALWFSESPMTEQIHHLLIQRGLRFRDEHVLHMASALSSSILYSSSSSSSGGSPSPHANLSVGFSEQLMSMLSQERDAASHHITRMLTLAVLERPYVLIPQLFQLLQQNNTAARKNALDVLAALPNCGEETARTEEDGEAAARGTSSTHEQGPDPRMRETLRILAEHLIMRLQDEELCVRMQSASLFAKVCPEDVVEPLLCVNLQRDNTGRKQSVSKSALEAILRAHTTSAAVMLLLLTTAFNILHRDSGEKLPTESEEQVTQRKKTKKEAVAGDPDQPSADEQDQPQAFPRSESKSSGNTSLTRTPADLYSRALLYSTESIGGEKEASVTEKAEEANQPAGSETEKKAQVVDMKGNKMNYLLQSLCELWVKEVCNRGTVEAPLTELLQAAKKAPQDSLEARQWYIKFVTHMLASLSTTLRTKPVACRTTVVQVICSQLLLDSGASSVPPEKDDEEHNVLWLAAIRDAAVLPPSESADSAFGILLPLLCLRSCDACFFSVEAQTEYTSLIWRCVWRTLLNEPYLAYMHRNREIQRVLLEVLCRFPSQPVLARVMEERTNRSELTLFLDRVTSFCLCYFVSGALQSRAVEVRGNTTSASAPAIEVDEASLSYFVQHTVQDLIAGNVTPYTSSKYYTETEWHKFTLSVLEAMALLLLLSVSSTPESPVAVQVGEQCIFGPLRQLAALYREAKKTGSLIEGPRLQELQELQLRVAFSLQVNNQALQIMERHPQGPELYLLWYRQYARTCIEFSNASCAYATALFLACAAKTDSEDANDVVTQAAQCAEILFRAVILSSKLDTNRQLPPPQAASKEETPSPSLLQKLPRDEKEALLSFAIGTTRYNKVPRMQQTGVRLLSGILGAAPDLFADVDMDGGSMHVLNDAVAALQNIALMFSHTPTRLLAEQVLNVFSPNKDK